MGVCKEAISGELCKGVKWAFNPLPDPGVSHGRRLGHRSRPAAAGAAPEVPWYCPMASRLRLGVNNKSSQCKF